MVNYGWPFWFALPVAIATGAVLGGITELLVVRRLFKQPRLLLFVATIGMAQVILLVQLQLPTVQDDRAFPTAFDQVWKIGALTVRGEQLVVLLMVPAHRGDPGGAPPAHEVRARGALGGRQSERARRCPGCG